MSKKILIIDDVSYNIEFEKSLITMLVKELHLDTIDIDSATNMAEAITMIKTKDYDALFIDMNLPDGSGIDIAKYVHKHCPSSTRIAALTMYKDIFEKDRALFDLFLTKPITPDNYKLNVMRLLQLD